MSTAMWKLEKDLCRCCHAEGSFKHLSDPCFLLGQEEIYSVMLEESLDIKVVPMTGPLSDATYTICDACVVRLRDASNFKRQVQECEDRFKEMYSKNMIKGFEVKEEPFESDADMKQEFHSVEEEDDDDDDDDAFLKFDDDADESFEDHEETITVEIEALPQTKGKGKAKPKPKPKKPAPVKKSKPKEKPIKLETEDLTEAAVSGEKKKGLAKNYLKYCTEPEKGKSNVYTCNVCSKTFKFRDFFREHFQNVHLKLRKKTHPCPVCYVQLIPNQKSKHMEEVHGRTAPTCGACGKKFAYPHLLRKHQRYYHMGEKNFKCELCDKAFATRQRLLEHSSKHSDLRPYTCEYCSKAYKTLNNLHTHSKTHVHEGKYVCSVCGSVFALNGSLKYHMKQIHPTLKD